ncbi:MAG: PhnD/SsuA/transferrin family substrate-binding protein [Steroidobacteraceae bacterium]
MSMPVSARSISEDSCRIAALPMYDFPELRGAHDALWNALAEQLTERGIGNVPHRLTRDRLHQDIWRDPSLLLGQGCEYPIAKAFADSLTLVATPRYTAPGCEGRFYRSVIVVRADDHSETLAALRNRRCVVNETDSNSGMNLLRAAVAPFAGGASFFQSVFMSGSHRRSVAMIAADEADLAAIDCVTFAHLQRVDPALTSAVRVLCWTPRSPCLPFVTARTTSESTVAVLRESLAAVLADSTLADVRERLFLDDVDVRPDTELRYVRTLEREAVALRYPVLR